MLLRSHKPLLIWKAIDIPVAVFAVGQHHQAACLPHGTTLWCTPAAPHWPICCLLCVCVSSLLCLLTAAAARLYASLCRCLCVQVAFENSVDKHRLTPYSRAATEAFDMVYSGGKPDDITVLVAVIK